MVDVNRRFLGWGLSAYLGQWGCFSTRCESLALNVLGATNGWSLSSMSPQGIQQFSQNDPTLVQNDANNKSKTDPKWTFPQLDSISVNEFEPFLFSMSGPRQTPRGPTWANVAIHGQGDVKYSIILHRWIYIYINNIMIYDVYTIYIIYNIYIYIYIYTHKYMYIYIIHRAQKNNSWTLDSCWSGWMGSRRGAARWIGNWHQLILEEEIQRSKRRASPMAIIFFSGTTSMFPETPLIYIYIYII